jgi:serine/threonine protein kinase
VWALGIILYELCTLEKPFHSDSLLGIVLKIVQEPVPELKPKLPYGDEIRSLIKLLLEKKP